MAEEAPQAPPRRAPGIWFVLAPAIALVVGLVLGGLLVWAGQEDPTDTTASADGSAPTPSPTPSATGAATEVVVPAECLEAADTVEAATGVFRDLASALRDFRANELRELLTELEELEQQARDQADACRQVQVDQDQ